jgi:hypothetical protein
MHVVELDVQLIYVLDLQGPMNIMATPITGKKFPQFHHTERGT